MTDLNRRLTTLDAAFLYFEKSTEPMHIGSCGVYDGDLRAEAVAAVLDARMHRLGRYRQRVVFPPFGFAHPTWEDDPDFDVLNHVVEHTLPAPGGRDQLCEAGGEIFAEKLDRDRPLWELVLLRGLEGGKTGVISKIHHAMVDGMSGVELTMVMHDLKADPGDDPEPVPPFSPKPIPDGMTLFQEAVRDRLTENTKRLTDDAFQWLKPADGMQEAQGMMRAMNASMTSIFAPQPRIPFNGPISKGRAFSWAQFPFHEVRAVKSELGGTVNDLVLAILAGGLGRYLEANGVATKGVQLRAMCPVSMRPPADSAALGNLVSTMIAPLFVGIEDPLERLRAEREAMEKLKQSDQAGGFFLMSRLGDRVPPVWQALAGMFSVPNTLFNTVSTNVPGPQIPLYLGGSELLDWYPLGPLSAGIGLFVAILSYNGKLTMGTTVDPKLVPDVWELSGYLQESYEELRAAALGPKETSSAKPRAAKPKKKAGARSRSAGKKPPVGKAVDRVRSTRT